MSPEKRTGDGHGGRYFGQTQRAIDAGLGAVTVESVRQGCYSDAELDALIEKRQRAAGPSEQSNNPPTGTVEIDLSIEVPVEAIVQHWTRDEAAALVGGDPVARDELISQAINHRGSWSGFDLLEADVIVEGRRL